MKERIQGILFVLLVALISGCSEPAVRRGIINGEASTTRVFVVHDYWHAAIVVTMADLSPEILPEIRDFAGADYLEFSWGDREYFPHRDPGIALALKAAFWSSGSTIHVVGVRGSPATFYPNAEILAIALSVGEFQRLVEFVSGTFVRSHPQSPSEAAPGLLETGRFYPARGRFSVFRTCNTWVAEGLRAAELPINPGWVLTAGSLARHVRPLATKQ